MTDRKRMKDKEQINLTAHFSPLSSGGRLVNGFHPSATLRLVTGLPSEILNPAPTSILSGKPE